MRQGKPKRALAVGALSVAFNVYLGKGGLDWLPDWMPIAVMVPAALYWLGEDPQVRSTLAASFRTESGKIIHPGTNKPAQSARLRKGKAAMTITAVLVVASVAGSIAWKYRAEALAVIGHGIFVFSGAYHDPFGGPEQFLIGAGCGIVNRTRYATGLSNWKTSLKFRDGRSVEGTGLLATDADVPVGLMDSNGRLLTMRAVDYLPVKAMQPIPPGGETSGWLSSVFKGYTRNDVRGKGVILIVEFSEIVTGKQHVVTYSLDNPGAGLPPGTFRVRRALGPPRP